MMEDIIGVDTITVELEVKQIVIWVDYRIEVSVNTICTNEIFICIVPPPEVQ